MGIVTIFLYANEQFLMGTDFKNLEDIRSEFRVTPPLTFILPRQSAEFSNILRDAMNLGELFIGQNPFKVLGYEFFIEEDSVKGEPVKHGRGVRLLPATMQV